MADAVAVKYNKPKRTWKPIMQRIALIAAALFVALPLLADDVDIEPLLGENWYGLYLNGQKTGFAVNRIARDDDGVVTVSEEAQFKVNMVGARQDMRILSERRYAPDGSLISIQSEVNDPSGASRFDAKVDGDTMHLVSVLGGNEKTSDLPRPRERLVDSVKHARWVRTNPSIGDSIAYTLFEPMYEKEISGVSTITAIEGRVFDGVPTQVYKIDSTLDVMGIDSTTWVAESGQTLEDVVAGIITMRLEPEEQARDVNYSNDVIVSNAALVEDAIPDPRRRKELTLLLRGPLDDDHLFSDSRQHIAAVENGFRFHATLPTLEGFEPESLPITEAEVRQWLQPTLYVQSDHPNIVAKAEEIVGGETDSFTIARKLCNWVNANMRSAFSARLSNAVEVLDHLEGDCTEHSVLFIALARAAGLPAREVAGLVYVDGVQRGFYFHQWAKVWIGRWIDVDPTFNQPLADTTHIKLAEGDLFQQARLIPIIGNLRIEVVDTP